MFAFITTILFMVYPVNSGLMSLRSFAINFGKLSLAVATYFVLDCRDSPRKLRLLGTWLALILNVGTYEYGYAVIAVVPVLWWWRSPRLTWGNVNLTVIWYLFPAVKVAYLLLLSSAEHSFYGSDLFSNAMQTERFGLESLDHYVGIVGNVYRQTFWYGWREANSSLGQVTWILPSLFSLAMVATVAVWLTRSLIAVDFPSRRKIAFSVFAGLLFIVPSVGVLMWLEKYNRDLWRMYVYVPVGAAVALVSLLVLLVQPLHNFRLRNLVLIILCLLLLFPALLRLFVQHAYLR